MLKVLSKGESIITIKDPSKDFIAGAAAIATPIIFEMNGEQFDKSNPLTLWVSDSLVEYKVVNNTSISKLNFINEDVYIGDTRIRDLINNYGVFVKSINSRGPTYNVFQFNTKEFILGMKYFAEIVDKDFQEYIALPPFDRYGKLFDVEGIEYQTSLSWQVFDNFEPNEVDDEEVDDENVNDPYNSIADSYDFDFTTGNIQSI